MATRKNDKHDMEIAEIKEQLKTQDQTLKEMRRLLFGDASIGYAGMKATQEKIDRAVEAIEDWKNKIEDNKGKIIIKIDTIGAKFMWIVTIIGAVLGVILAIKQLKG